MVDIAFESQNTILLTHEKFGEAKRRELGKMKYRSSLDFRSFEITQKHHISLESRNEFGEVFFQVT